MKYLLLPFALLFWSYVYSQSPDSITIKVNWGVESKELQDLYRFENVDYFTIHTQGEIVKGKHYKVIVKEYWNNKLAGTDTVVDTKRRSMPLTTNELTFRLMSRKTESDSVKLMCLFPNFQIARKYKTTTSNTYSLRDASNGKAISHQVNKPITLFAYSLPYKDPKQPGWLLYCELSREGIPPEKWGEKFGIEHYITMDLTFE